MYSVYKRKFKESNKEEMDNFIETEILPDLKEMVEKSQYKHPKKQSLYLSQLTSSYVCKIIIQKVLLGDTYVDFIQEPYKSLVNDLGRFMEDNLEVSIMTLHNEDLWNKYLKLIDEFQIATIQNSYLYESLKVPIPKESFELIHNFNSYLLGFSEYLPKYLKEKYPEPFDFVMLRDVTYNTSLVRIDIGIRVIHYFDTPVLNTIIDKVNELNEEYGIGYIPSNEEIEL